MIDVGIVFRVLKFIMIVGRTVCSFSSLYWSLVECFACLL